MPKARAYYNEIDKFCVEWLKNLIAEGLIAPGDVDDRDIRDVLPSELRGYSQCHFFAGIGGWSYALRLAGWRDDHAVWTGSCPCQPFSAAGKRRGEADERHLWPAFYHLIQECRPTEVFGEQVASKDGKIWFTGVRTDLEALGYGAGGADLCAAGVGAPHIRQRLFWVAQSNGRQSSNGELQRSGKQRQQPEDGCASEWMADNLSPRLEEWQEQYVREECATSIRGRDVGGTGGMGHAECSGNESRRTADQSGKGLGEASPRPSVKLGRSGNSSRLAEPDNSERRTAPRNLIDRGQAGRDQSNRKPGEYCETDWSDFDLVHCRDGKSRRIEPGSFPLAHGISARMGKLRGYGNAIVPQVAAEFIQAYLEI